MAERIPQSQAYLVVFRAYLASDGITPATGKTIAITISKNGATSFSNPAAGATNATEMASGFYKFTLAAGDTDTQGPLTWRGAEAAINDAGDVLTVESPTRVGIIDEGTAQAATATTLQLRAAAAFADDELIGATILITGGTTGVGQRKVITDYVSATDTATVSTWTTTPTGTITYLIFASAPGDSVINDIRDAVFARAFSAATGSYTFDELMKMCAAVLLGKASGLAGTTATYRNLADSADVVVATVDASGNRSAITRTP